MNKLRFFLIGAAALLGSAVASAVPAKPGLHDFRCPDGSEISLRRVGDESFHSFVTTDGLTVSRGGDGYFYYVTADGVSAQRASNPSRRSAAEKAFIAGREGKLSVKALRAARVAGKSGEDKGRYKISGKRRRANSGTASPLDGDLCLSQVPQKGAPRVPVLLVQYSDYKFKDSDPNKIFSDFFDNDTKSARQYFIDQSNGLFTPQFDVFGPVTLTNKRAYYGGNDEYGNDQRVCTMVAEACKGLDSQINFRNYDNDGDGECDVVIVLYAGDGEASSYEDDAEDAVWPCQWGLGSKDSDYAPGALTLDGTTVDLFAVFNELNGEDLSKIDGVGTFCHEFSHCLGLPDFYDTNYGPHFGMGVWSLMDQGSYNDNTYTPIGYSAYEKEFMGWIEIPEAKENTRYTLPVMNRKSIDTDLAVRLTNDADPDEYYILENRARQGWDAFMPADGLMISHFTYDETAWVSNVVNDYDLQRATLVPADGELKLDEYLTWAGEIFYVANEESLLGDLWPYGDATELTDESVPAAKMNTGGYLSKPVTEITRNDDGTISFWTMKEPLPAVAAPVNVDHDVLSSTSARIRWNAGDALAQDYLLQVYPHVEVTSTLVFDEDWTTSDAWQTEWDYDGYVAVDKGAEADGLRFGSNKQVGMLVSPEFGLDGNSVVTVTFTAKSYGNDNSSIVVSVLDQDYEELSSKTVQLSNQHAVYTLVLDAATQGDVSVWFETTGKKARFYLKDVKIYSGDASATVAAAPAAPAAPGRRVTTLGTPVAYIVKGATSMLLEGLESGAVYSYRVRALAADPAVNSDSAWSPMMELNLSETTGVCLRPADADGEEGDAVYYDLLGRPMSEPEGVCIEMLPSGKIRKVVK